MTADQFHAFDIACAQFQIAVFRGFNKENLAVCREFAA